MIRHHVCENENKQIYLSLENIFKYIIYELRLYSSVFIGYNTGGWKEIWKYLENPTHSFYRWQRESNRAGLITIIGIFIARYSL